jgi:hypothetical protein
MRKQFCAQRLAKMVNCWQLAVRMARWQQSCHDLMQSSSLIRNVLNVCTAESVATGDGCVFAEVRARTSTGYHVGAVHQGQYTGADLIV